MEFRNVSGLKTESDSTLITVPASRADLFSSKRVTVMEKRKMMNFLTKALQENGDKTEKCDNFEQFLDKFKLTEKLKKFISASIVFAPADSLSREQGLGRVDINA